MNSKAFITRRKIMSIFMQATVELNAYKVEDFLQVMRDNLIPLMEEQGWRLHGCFVERFGSVKPAIVTDLWEMEDMAHVERVLNATATARIPATWPHRRSWRKRYWAKKCNLWNSARVESNRNTPEPSFFRAGMGSLKIGNTLSAKKGGKDMAQGFEYPQPLLMASVHAQAT